MYVVEIWSVTIDTLTEHDFKNISLKKKFIR